nr:MAG TPA: hypothetical protein [Caudoviricetes sp.]
MGHSAGRLGPMAEHIRAKCRIFAHCTAASGRGCV